MSERESKQLRDMNFRHPPPWKAVRVGVGRAAIWEVTNISDDPDDEYDVFEDPTEDEARLGAAAPDLLVVCKEVLCALPERSPMRPLIKAAIAKAEGRTP